MEFEDNVKKSFDKVKDTTDGLQSVINSCEKRLDKLAEQGCNIENLLTKINELHDTDVKWKKVCWEVLNTMVDGYDDLHEKQNNLCEVMHIVDDHFDNENRKLKLHGIWLGCGVLLCSMVFSTMLYFI